MGVQACNDLWSSTEQLATIIVVRQASTTTTALGNGTIVTTCCEAIISIRILRHGKCIDITVVELVYSSRAVGRRTTFKVTREQSQKFTGNVDSNNVFIVIVSTASIRRGYESFLQ